MGALPASARHMGRAAAGARVGGIGESRKGGVAGGGWLGFKFRKGWKPGVRATVATSRKATVALDH